MSRRKETRLPSLTTLESIKEALDVRLGRRGDPMDRALTMRDIIESGVPIKAVRRGGLNDFYLEYQERPQKLVPKAPEGLVALSVFGGIHILWDSPGSNASRLVAEISRSTSSDAETRDVLTYAGGNSFLDMVDSQDETEYFYWVRFLSDSGHYGPYAGSVSAIATPRVSDVLEELTGQIDESHLAESLGTEIGRIGQIDPPELIGRIDESHLAESLGTKVEQIGRIDPLELLVIGPETLDGSVDQRIAAERAARIAADDQEAQARYDAIRDEQQARADAIASEAAARGQAVSSETADRIADVAAERDARVLAIQEEQGGRAAAITAEQEARTTGDEALGSRIDSLTVAVGDNSADITAEQQARADGDSALASDVSALQASVGNNEAAILSESEARATDLGLIAKQLDAVSASYRTNASTIYTLEEVRISDREATATRIDGLEVRVDGNEALVFQEQQARADADSILATNISVLSAKIDSLPTYSNSFEAGAQYDRWIAGTDHSIRPESTDTYVGESAAVIGSTAASVDTSMPPFALAVPIPAGSAGAFLARRLRLSLAAKAFATGASSEFAIGYSVGDWFSGWDRFTPSASWEVVGSLVDVPEDVTGDHYFVIWADTAGAGGEVLVDRALVEVAEAEIPEITAQITAEQQARADGDAALSSQITAALSRVDGNEAAIISEADTRAAEDTALASDITSLSARVSDNEAGIVDEASVRASADDAAALRIDGVVADVASNAAAISTEQTVRADADTALGQQITAVDSRVDESRSLITQEATARSTADSALAENIQTLTATTGDLAADIQTESTARADADAALAQDVTDLWAGVDGNEARITDEASTRASEDSLLAMVQQVVAAKSSASSAITYSLEEVRLNAEAAMATRIDGMQVAFDEAQASFEEEQTVRADADSALAQQITTAQSALGDDIATVQSDLNSEVTRLDGRVDSNAQALTTAQSALGDDIATVQSDLNSEVTRLDGRVDSNAQALTTAQSALGDDIATVQSDLNSEVTRLDGRVESNAQALTGLQAEVDDNEARITDEASARASEDSLLAMVQQVVAAKSSASSATTYTLEEVRLDAESAMATRIDGMQVSFDAAQALFEEEQTIRADADSALAQQITTAQSALGDDIATVQQDLSSEVTRLDGRVDSTAQAITTAQSEIGDDIASVQTSLTTNISRVDDELVALGAQYTAQVQANGLIGGFGIYNDGTTVDAGFDVDTFWVGRTNDDKRKPFIIQDGVTYIDTAMIRDASIQEGKIGPITFGKLTATDGSPVTTAAGTLRADMIDVGSLRIGFGQVTGNLKSSALGNNGRPAWLLDRTGGFELNSTGSGGNMEQRGDRISVYDSNGNLRVRIGRL